MPRSNRTQYEGAMYHVMNRGVNKNSIFLRPGHQMMFLEIMADIFQENEVEVYGFCLMDNHFHLLLKTSMGNLSKAMQSLTSLYVARVNKEVDRDGPLFRGRFKSKLIKNDSYLLNVSRYIHLNPSVSGIVEDDVNYPFSSYRYYASDIFTTPKWLNINDILSMFNYKKSSYVKYVQQQNIKDDFKPYHFCNDYPSLEELLNYLTKYFNISRDDILSRTNIKYRRQHQILLLLADLNHNYTKSQKSDFFKMSRVAYYSKLRTIYEKLSTDQFLKNNFERLKQELY